MLLGKKNCIVCDCEIKVGGKKIKAGMLCKKCYAALKKAETEKRGVIQNTLIPVDWAIDKLSVQDIKNSLDEYQKKHPGFWTSLGNTLEEAHASNVKIALDNELANNKKVVGETVREIKMTCSACGHVHFYSGDDIIQNTMHAMKGMMGYGGAIGSSIEYSQVKELQKCPMCGSIAVKCEEIFNTIQ